MDQLLPEEYSLGKEYVLPDEQTYIDEIIRVFKKKLPDYYPKGKVKRMFHPKIHGLVKANFIVRPDLESIYQTGLFIPGKEYPCWIRFSNAKKKPSPDIKKDMRGMAIKLVGVPGKKLLEHDADAVTQDFLLVTAKTLQTRSVRDFQKSLSALMGGGVKLIWYALTHPMVIIRSIKQISRCNNLLDTSFFSTTPYRFGKDQSLAVKYAVVPSHKKEPSKPEKPGADFLKEYLINDLATNEFDFDFMVQFQQDAIQMPIEDPTVEWTSAFIKVATIKIPKQIFNSAAQEAYGENLSFTPWHSIPEHQPLGGVNRARKAVYIALSAFRHELNNKQESEPIAMESFS
jgi:hypothetical protein